MNRLLLPLALALLAALPTAAQPQKPDLSGGLLVSLSPPNGFPGDRRGVSVRAGNDGTVEAPPSTAAIYLSDDRFPSADDRRLATVRVPAVPVQRTIGVSAEITIPNVPRGGYSILVVLDDPNAIDEIDEGNNVNSGPFTVSPDFDGPDLLVSTSSLEDATAAPGDRISVEYVAANRGRSDVGDFEVGYYLRPINGPRSSWRFMDSETLGNLDAGDDDRESEQITVPPNTPPGRYAVLIFLDHLNAVAEPDETNNVGGAGLITITGATAGEVSPSAAALSLVASPNPAGAAVRLSYTLAEAQTVRLSVVDALGRTVAVVAGARAAGAHAEALDTSGWAPGVYAVRLVAGGEAAVQTLTVVR